MEHKNHETTINYIGKFAQVFQDKIDEGLWEYSNVTIKSYLGETTRFYKQIEIPTTQQPTKELCIQWRKMASKRYAKKSYALKCCAINLFLKEVIGWEWQLPQAKNIDREREPTVLPESQVMAMVDMAYLREKYTQGILIYLTYETASRKTAIQNLKIKDINETKKLITLKVKGGKTHKTPISQEAMDRLKEYLTKYRPIALPEHEQWVFISEITHKKINDDYLKNTLKYYASKLDITQSVYPHCLRHSRIKALRDRGFEWEEVLSITGHKDLLSLTTYIHEESITEVQKKLDNGHRSPEDVTQQPINNDLQKENDILREKLQTLEIQLKPHQNSPDINKGYW